MFWKREGVPNPEPGKDSNKPVVGDKALDEYVAEQAGLTPEELKVLEEEEEEEVAKSLRAKDRGFQK